MINIWKKKMKQSIQKEKQNIKKKKIIMINVQIYGRKKNETKHIERKAKRKKRRKKT